MLRLFANANYDFLRVRRASYTISLIFSVIGLGVLAVRGLNESIEFTGGTLVQIHANTPEISTATIRSALAEAGITSAEIQTFGAPTEFVIRASIRSEEEAAVLSTQETRDAVEAALLQTLGQGSFEIARAEAVSAKVGSELRTKALFAILMSFAATLVYLTIRFEWRFGIAAIVATAHDIVATIAFIALMNLEVSLVIVAAVLTIVGYSLNDTIVVFDRVRENLRKYKRQNIYEVLNRSVNETLPRTVLTGITTMVATLALLIFGGEVIRGFAWVMTFGIIIGTFSSIYIASPVLLAVEQRWPGEDVRGARTLASQTAAQHG